MELEVVEGLHIGGDGWRWAFAGIGRMLKDWGDYP